MTSTTKITIKKNEDPYTYIQNQESVSISVPLKNVLLKNVNIMYTSNYIKINVPSIKFLLIIDLMNEIDYESSRNRVQLQDEKLEIFLMKKEVGQLWENLKVLGLTKEEIKERRDRSTKEYEKRQEEKYKAAESKRHEMDKAAIDKQMDIEKFQRKQIKGKKEEEKKQFENEMYKELEQADQKDQQLQAESKIETAVKSIQKEVKPVEEKQVPAKVKAVRYKDENDIFDDEDCAVTGSNSKVNGSEKEQEQEHSKEEHEEMVQEVEEIVEVPGVRQQQDLKMQFTEKKFPHLPARESHLKEPPFPKSKKIEKKHDGVYIDIEDKDPVWLKDKGDHFFKRNDYMSAINAYTKAIEFDKEFLMCRLNRSSAYLKVRAFQNCIDDCIDIQSQIEGLKESEREDEFYPKAMGRMHLKRGAAYAWTSQYDKAIEDLNEAVRYKQVFNEKHIAEIERDIKRLEQRKQSIELKNQGDFQFADSNLEEAKKLYEQALEFDKNNEYAIGNLGLICLKRLQYKECIEYSSRALEIIDSFQNETKSFQKDNRLEIKLLLRRGKSYEMVGEYEKSKEDMDNIIILEPQNGEARALLKTVQVKLDGILFEKYRTIANEHLQKKEFHEALEFYEKSLRITKKGTSLDNIGVYVNKIACLLALGKEEQVILECNDALRLIKNYRNKFDDKIQSQEEKQKINQMEIRVSVRRGNALAKMNRVTEAIQEYEKALKLDPKNANIIKDLEFLRKGQKV